MQTAISAFADRDPQGALALLQSTPSARGRHGGAYWSIFNRWANSDVMTAATAAARLPAGGGRENALQAVASTWTGQDPEAAFNWAIHCRREVRGTAPCKALLIVGVRAIPSKQLAWSWNFGRLHA